MAPPTHANRKPVVRGPSQSCRHALRRSCASTCSRQPVASVYRSTQRGYTVEFSHSAEQNAENLLMLTSPALADAYSDYIDHLMAKYGG